MSRIEKDLKTLQDKVAQSKDVKDQTRMVGMLQSQVQQFTSDIENKRQLVNSLNDVQQELDIKKREVKDLEKKISEIKSVASQLRRDEQELRKIQDSVANLNREIDAAA